MPPTPIIGMRPCKLACRRRITCVDAARNGGPLNPPDFKRQWFLREAGPRNRGIGGDHCIHVVFYKQTGDGIDSNIVQIGCDLEGDRHTAVVGARQNCLFILEGGEQGGERCFVLQGAQPGGIGRGNV